MILNAFLLKSDPKHGRVGVEHCYTSVLKLELWICQGGRAWLSAETGGKDFKKLSMEIGMGGKRAPPDSLHLPLLSCREQEYETNGHYILCCGRARCYCHRPSPPPDLDQAMIAHQHIPD